MYRVLRLLAPILLLVGCEPSSPEQPPVDQVRDERMGTPTRQPVVERDPDSCKARTQRRLAAKEADLASLTERLARSGADAEREAHEAAAKGAFGLIWLRHWGDSQPSGVLCRGPDQADMGPDMPLERFGLHIDHIPLPPGQTPPKTDAALAAYALRYNRAMLADPSFPYADICAQAKPRPQLTQNDIRQPDEWAGPPPAPPTSRPLSLGEAARHGTAASLDQWIARRAGRLDEPDDFALTPLAWAVLHDRPEAVRRLLAAGADPYPTLCNQHPEAPALVLAMRLRRPYVIEMARAGGLGTRRPWPRLLMRIAVETDQVALVRLMLSQPNQAGNDPLHRRDAPLSPAMKRALDARKEARPTP